MKKQKILLIDDDKDFALTFSGVFDKKEFEVRTESSLEDIVSKVKAWYPDVVLLDVVFPEQCGLSVIPEIVNADMKAQVVVITADNRVNTAVQAMKFGAADYLLKPFNAEEMLMVISNVLEKKRLSQEVESLRKFSTASFECELTGESRAIKELKLKIDKFAKARVSSILITGESGTGKELVARRIHRALFGSFTQRCEPYVGINCAALPEQILESELFGYEKGSFTDAKSSKKGVFELANGGLILLDEIGEMKPELQSKLLRVLEERTIRRIGGKEDIPLDITVVATTNKNLSQSVKKQEFRVDLFYRLSSFYLHLVPLRERKEDIPPLARHFLEVYSKKYHNYEIKHFSPEAEDMLLAYDWPGNVRELRNLVERLVVLEHAETITAEHMPAWLTVETKGAGVLPADKFILPEKGISLDDFEKDLIRQALERAHGNKTVAAKLLNLSYDSLRYQIKRFGL